MTNIHDPRALNAYRHGLTGQIRIFTPDERAVFDKHCQSIHEALAPVGAMEIELVQSVCDDRWRLKRAAAIEDALFASYEPKPGSVEHGEEEMAAALSAAGAWRAEAKNLQLLTLYESRIQRRVEKNLALLRQLQQDRRKLQTTAVQQDSRRPQPERFDFSSLPGEPGSVAGPLGVPGSPELPDAA